MELEDEPTTNVPAKMGLVYVVESGKVCVISPQDSHICRAMSVRPSLTI